VHAWQIHLSRYEIQNHDYNHVPKINQSINETRKRKKTINYEQVLEYLLDGLVILLALLVSAKRQGLLGYAGGNFFYGDLQKLSKSI